MAWRNILHIGGVKKFPQSQTRRISAPAGLESITLGEGPLLQQSQAAAKSQSGN